MMLGAAAADDLLLLLEELDFAVLLTDELLLLLPPPVPLFEYTDVEDDVFPDLLDILEDSFDEKDFDTLLEEFFEEDDSYFEALSELSLFDTVILGGGFKLAAKAAIPTGFA